MSTLLRASILVSTLSATAMAAQIPLPTPLSNLVGTGDFVISGSLTFDSFTYAITGDMPPATSVNVIAHVDPDGNAGLRFQAAFVDSTTAGGSDALIGYTVSASSPVIRDAHLAGNPDLLGGTGLASVTETFLPTIDNASLSIFDNGSVEQLTDQLVFAPVQQLAVLKDISLLAESGGAGAAISFVDQSFSLVPEPSCFFGLVLGCLAMSGLRRRRE